MEYKNKNIMKKVRDTIDTNEMIKNNAPIIVGVSGGPDSMVLLDILSKLVPNKLIAAHLNHQFRGKEAEADANFVKSECLKRKISFELKEYDVPAYMKQTGLGVQEAAREIRYKFYENIADKWNATTIALGHHANDQAETILMRIIRGTGMHGLSGIPYLRKTGEIEIIRPLLDIQREDVEHYCLEHNIPYIIDKSNLSTKYFRNKIRLEVIPFLNKYNPKITSHLNQLSKVIQDENHFLEKLANDFLEENSSGFLEDKFKLDIYRLKNLDIALQRRVIHLILRYLNLKDEFTFLHIKDILYLVNQDHPSKSIDLPGVKVFRNYEEIVFTTKFRYCEPFSYILSIPGELVLDGPRKKIHSMVSNTYEEKDGLWAVFDYDMLITKELIVRTRVKGDRIELQGLNGSKKVKDIFIDKKISKEMRDAIPIIEHHSDIIWIPGIKRSKHGLISDSTKLFLYIIVEDL